jgi:hypothetical protein
MSDFNCWNCGNLMERNFKNKSVCEGCNWLVCQNCGKCSPSCNHKFLIATHKRWLKDNCEVCKKSGNCTYEIPARNRKIMFEKINQNNLVKCKIRELDLSKRFKSRKYPNEN